MGSLTILGNKFLWAYLKVDVASAEELTEDQNEAKQLENARGSCRPDAVFFIGHVVGANDQDEYQRTCQNP